MYIYTSIMHVNKLCMSLYFKLDTADMYNEDLNQDFSTSHKAL